MAILYPFENPITGTYHRQVLQELFSIIEERRIIFKYNQSRSPNITTPSYLTESILESQSLSLETTIRHLFITCAYSYRDLDYNPTFAQNNNMNITPLRQWNMSNAWSVSSSNFYPSLTGLYYGDVSNKGFFTMEEMLQKWEVHTGSLPNLRAINRLRDASYVDFSIDSWSEGRLATEDILRESFLIVKYCMNELIIDSNTGTRNVSNTTYTSYNIGRYTTQNSSKIHYGNTVPIGKIRIGGSEDPNAPPTPQQALDQATAQYKTDNTFPNSTGVRNIRSSISYSSSRFLSGSDIGNWEADVKDDWNRSILMVDLKFNLYDVNGSLLVNQKNIDIKTVATDYATGDYKYNKSEFVGYGSIFTDNYKVTTTPYTFLNGEYLIELRNYFDANLAESVDLSDLNIIGQDSGGNNKYFLEKGYVIASMGGSLDINDSDFISNVT